MLTNFRHKGLKRLYDKGDPSGIRSDLIKKVTVILSALDAAEIPSDMDLPMLRLHALTGDRKGYFAVTVKANWRITFCFCRNAACDVDLEDYH